MAYAIENNKSIHKGFIKIVNLKGFEYDTHNGVLSSQELGEGLTEVALNRIDKVMNR